MPFAAATQSSPAVRCFLGFCLLLISFNVQAQAGSRPALLFDSVDSFYNSIAGSLVSVSGAEHQRQVVPEGALLLPEDMRYLLWVELEAGRLNVLEKLSPDSYVLRRRIPVSIGKQGIGKQREGDQKTPVGVYRLTSFLTDGQLDDFYGLGAYPLNYPNPRDELLGRTGHGIWLHGLPKDIAQRPLLDSDGCVVIDNESLLSLAPMITRGQTFIVMGRGQIHWVDAASQFSRRDELQRALMEWKQAWEARDNDRYLDFYAEDFSDLNRDKEAWSAYKRRVNNAKKRIDLEFSNMTMMADPQQLDLVTIRYYQDYRSDNYSWTGWKEQVWRDTDEGWRIIFEGNG